MFKIFLKNQNQWNELENSLESTQPHSASKPKLDMAQGSRLCFSQSKRSQWFHIFLRKHFEVLDAKILKQPSIFWFNLFLIPILLFTKLLPFLFSLIHSKCACLCLWMSYQNGWNALQNTPNKSILHELDKILRNHFNEFYISAKELS